MGKRPLHSGDSHPQRNGDAEKKLDAFYGRQYSPEERPVEAGGSPEPVHTLDLGQGLTTRPTAKPARSAITLAVEPDAPAGQAKSAAFIGLVTGVVLLAVFVLGLFYYPAWSARQSATNGNGATLTESALSPRAQSRLLDDMTELLKPESTPSPESLAKAETHLQSVLKADPLNARAYKLLGDLYGHRNRIDASIESYQKALKAQPNYLEALLPLALIYDTQRNIPEAISYYQRAGQLRPIDNAIRLRLASLYTASDQKEAAINQYRAALNLKLDTRTRAKVNDEIKRLTRLLRDEKNTTPTADTPPPKTPPVKNTPMVTAAQPAALDATNTARMASLQPKAIIPLTATTDLAFPPPVLREVITADPAPADSVSLKEAPGRPPSVTPNVTSPPSPPVTPPASAIPPKKTGPAADLVAPHPMTAPMTPLPKPVQEGDELSADAVDKKPVLRSRVDPRMPAAARNMTGTVSVFMSVKISETGRVMDTRVIRKPEKDLGFTQAAEAAVRQWRYEPAMKNGVKVKVWTTCQIHFKQAE